MSFSRTRPAPSFPTAGEAGLTLVEVVVATGLLVLLMGVTLGGFTASVRGYRSRVGTAALLGDAQRFLELLEREVRTGYGNTFGGGGAEFFMKNQDGDCVKYRLDGVVLRREVDEVDACDPANMVPTKITALTESATEVRVLEFFGVTQAGKVDPDGSGPLTDMLTDQQGRVTVRLRVCPPAVDDERCVIVQTSLTSRQYAPAP